MKILASVVGSGEKRKRDDEDDETDDITDGEETGYKSEDWEDESSVASDSEETPVDRLVAAETVNLASLELRDLLSDTPLVDESRPVAPLVPLARSQSTTKVVTEKDWDW